MLKANNCPRSPHGFMFRGKQVTTCLTVLHIHFHMDPRCKRDGVSHSPGFCLSQFCSNHEDITDQKHLIWDKITSNVILFPRKEIVSLFENNLYHFGLIQASFQTKYQNILYFRDSFQTEVFNSQNCLNLCKFTLLISLQKSKC